jgi:hypothetical protein
VIPGERADQAVRELSSEYGFEALTPTWRSLDETCHTDAVLEQAADCFDVGLRRDVHGTPVIGGLADPAHPWRE